MADSCQLQADSYQPKNHGRNGSHTPVKSHNEVCRILPTPASKKMIHRDHHASSPPPAGGFPFAEADWQHLQAEDLHAARAVVGLMASIFTVGLFIYTLVALTVKGVIFDLH
jgi:hypothetical protein